MLNKIVYLCPVTYFKGGAERSLFDLLNNDKIDPLLIVPGHGEIYDYAQKLGIKVRVAEHYSLVDVERKGFSFSNVFKILELFRVAKAISTIADEHGAKIIHSNGMKSHVINIVCDVVYNKISVIHLRDIAIGFTENVIWSLISNLSKAVVVVSQATIPKFQLKNNVNVIHNGINVDSDRFENHSGSNKGLTIGFIGRIHKDKGIDWLINAVAHSIQNERDIQLKVIGLFEPEKDHFHKALVELIDELNIYNKVTFCGFVEDKNEIYKGLDLVCVPSVTPDPFPRSVMEAMAFKIPVMAFASGGIIEMIDDTNTGFIITEDFSYFDDLVSNIINNTINIEVVSQKAYEKVQMNFTLDILKSKINHLYNKLL